MSMFNSVAFDSPLSQCTLDIESRVRTNPFPWRGQFSPQLIESLLTAYAPEGSVILDPFMGSGTVLVESAYRGLPVYGYEINPAAYILSRLYELCNLDTSTRRELLAETDGVIVDMYPAVYDLPLFAINDSHELAFDPDWIKDVSDPRTRMLVEAVVVLADGVGDAFASKWAAIRNTVSTMPYSETSVQASLGDARLLSIADDSVDFILSSPPYINVFNYHMNMRRGVELLGWRPLTVSKSEIGSNRKFRQNRFLTVVQYCIDMALALSELRRVCAETARVILILGRESNVQKTAFYNADIVERLANDVLGFRTRLKQQRAFKNRFGKTIYEDILHLSPQSGCGSVESIVEIAREVGASILLEAIHRTPEDRLCYLHDAINRATQVVPSLFFNASSPNGVRI